MAINAQNHLVQTRQASTQGFSAIINSPVYRQKIEEIINDPARAAQFISTVVSAVNSNPKLKLCEPGSIINAALQGEIAMGLSLALGEYSIIPYNGKNGYVAQFQLGANGLKQICIRTGKYRRYKNSEIRDGAFTGYDSFGDPIIDWSKNHNPEMQIIGYYCGYELMNGFSQTIYWTHDECLHHADRYAKAFSLKTYRDLLSGEITGYEAQKLKSGSQWYAAPDELSHIKMCKKTVAKQLLSDGIAPKEVVKAIRTDDAEEKDPGSVIPEIGAFNLTLGQAQEERLLEAAGPAIEESELAQAAQIPVEAPKKRGRPAKAQAATTADAGRYVREPSHTVDNGQLTVDSGGRATFAHTGVNAGAEEDMSAAGSVHYEREFADNDAQASFFGD